MAKKQFSFVVPARFMFFHYKDIPGEFHAVCLETGSFGVGSSQFEAMQHLSLSFTAQIVSDVLSSGFSPSVDQEWERAWAEGKHPAIDEIVIGMRGVGSIRIGIEKRSASVELGDDIRVGPVGQHNLQPA